MSVTVACPDANQFRRFLSGQMPAAEADVLLTHLEGCDACARQAAALADQDSLVALVRQSANQAEAVGSEKLSLIMQRLRKQYPANTHAGDVDKTLPPSVSPSMNALMFRCPGCKKSLKVAVSMAGKKVKCAHCQQVMQVPAAAVDNSSEKTLAPSQAPTPSPPTSGSAILGQPLSGDGNVSAENKDRELLEFLAPAQAPDELGRLGPYRVLKILGAGGMGVVYLAQDPQLKRLVALKAMLPGLGASASARQRFLREAQTAAAIKHDHIVSIYQVGEDRGAPYLAMEFLQGESLDQRLQREGKLPLAEVLRIGREMAEGMEAAHECGLIHRDIKPANVWLETRRAGGVSPLINPTDQGANAPRSPYRVKILDFGLARAASESAQLTQSGAIVGTPAFMAPEQAKSKNVDHRCDLFSLGVVLYRLCTGAMPFQGDDTISTLMAIATENPPPPSSISGDVPPALSDLVMQLLAKDPAQRPASARDAADRLEAMERFPVASIAAPIPPRAGRISDRSKPRRLLPYAAAVLLMLLPLTWFFGGTIIRIATNQGELIIDSSDPNIEVTVMNEKATIYDKVKERRFVLTAGKYEVEVREVGEGGLRFKTQKFTITRGGVETFHAHLELAQAKVPEVVKDPVKPPDVKKEDVKKDPVKLPDVKKDDKKKDPVKPPEVKKEEIKKDPVIPPEVKKDPKEKRKGPVEPPVVAKDPRLKPLDLSNPVLAQLPVAEAVIALGGKVGLDVYIIVPGMQGVSNGDRHADLPMKDLGPKEWVQQTQLDVEKLFTDPGIYQWKDYQGNQVQALNAVSICLAFGNERITDEALAQLAFNKLKSLGTLDLDVTKVGDPGLEQLKRLSGPTLNKLCLSHTLVSDAGLACLEKQVHLSELHLDGTAVTDVGLARLARFAELRGLGLRGTKVSDAGLKHLKDLPIALLDLSDTAVSDDGLAHLKWLKNLTYVNLRGTKVTAKGIFALRQARPKWFIDANFGAGGTADDWLGRIGGRVFPPGNIDFSVVPTSRYQQLQPNGFMKQHPDLWSPNKWVTSAGLENLKTMNHQLTGLNLQGTLVTGGLEHLKDVTSLTTLRLGNTMVSGTGLENLKMLRKLQVLDLNNTPLTDAGLANLSSLTQLTSLDLSNTPVTDAGMVHLTTLAELRHLNLQGTKVKVGGLKELASLKKIEKLYLSDVAVTDETLRALGESGLLPPWVNGRGNINQLDMSNTPVTDAALVYLKTLTNLRVLNLNGTKVTVAGLKELAPLTNLAIKLDLPMTDETLRVLRDNGVLPQWLSGRGIGNNLVLAGTQVTEAGLKELMVLNNLVILDLSKMQISDAGLVHLKTLTSLRVLNLNGTKVTIAGLKELASLKNLQTLNLDGVPVSDDALRALRENGLLAPWVNGRGKGNELVLAGTQVTDAGLKELSILSVQTERRGWQNLYILDLSNTAVTNAGLVDLKKLTSLNQLVLSGTKVDDAGLADLKTLPKLQRLVLNGTSVTDAGLAHLKTLTTLRELRLDGTKVTGPGLANLEPLTELQLLDLSNTPLTDAGLAHVQSLITLPVLRLNGTKVSDAGLVHLKELTNLHELSLGNTQVTVAGLAELRKALPKCKIQ